MAVRLSPKQRQIREREAGILFAARSILLSDGYYGLTMERIAAGSNCPKGTIYQHFACKEDVVLTLAVASLNLRFEILRRGAEFEGHARERMVGVGEGAVLFTRMHPEDAQIIYMARGSIREKASLACVREAVRVEHQMAELLRGILSDGVKQGDLELGASLSIEQMAFAFWALADGGIALSMEGGPQHALGMNNPYHDLWLAFNWLADGYGWRPLFSEWDWEETLAQVRRAVFREETAQVYGEGAWYGDAGPTHPRLTQYWAGNPSLSRP